MGDWKPNEKESVLHFPGVSSLARVLLTQWCDEEQVYAIRAEDIVNYNSSH